MTKMFEYTDMQRERVDNVRCSEAGALSPKTAARPPGRPFSEPGGSR
ncbi:hypothetical protein [Nocardia carnea]|nr:hypothetical protein [Nocardia carnea]